MKILTIVVTYFPSRELLLENLQAFIDDVDKILIWENTPISEREQYRFVENSKIEYCGDGINSISRALNFAWKYACANGYDYLLTMDQDSILVNFKEMIEYAQKRYSENIIIGPSYNIEDETFALNLINSQKPKVVETLITSGSFFYIGVLNALEGWDENLKIDGVDTDLSLRANSLGILSYKMNTCNLIQRFGEPKIGVFLGKKHKFSLYSPQRIRSISRAHIYLMRKYKTMSKDMQKYIVKHYFIDKIIEIVLFEGQKVSKLVAMVSGVYQGFVIKF